LFNASRAHAAHDLTHFTGMPCQRPRLSLNIFAVQQRHRAQIFGMQARLPRPLTFTQRANQQRLAI
jgi:hypothetical protein